MHRTRKLQVVTIGALGIALGTAGACGSNRQPDSAGSGSFPPVGAPPNCGPGDEGCPCTTPGESVACGHEISRSGDYVTCSEGTSVCQSGTWGACSGGQLLTRSLTSSSLSGGIRVQSAMLPCNSPDGGSNPCDPNGCVQWSFDAGDVDAFGLEPVEGGITIAPGVSQDGGGCASGQPTTLTGKAYDPAGVNPLYNAYVYVPVDPNLPAFATGAACDSCANEPTIHAVAFARTDATGKFTLKNVPAGVPIPLVVQMGKWRREAMLPAVAPCSTTTVLPNDARLPRNRFDGNMNHADIPKMAVATGMADPVECVLLKMGVDTAEFQLPAAGNGRVDYYVSNGAQFTGGTAPGLHSLVNSQATLSGYDAVLLPCEQTVPTMADTYVANVANYALRGGRLYVTHRGYKWLAMPGTNPFFGLASWKLEDHLYATAPAAIDTNFPKGLAFDQWMSAIGGLDPDGGITLTAPRRDTTGVLAATEWMHHVPDPPDAANPQTTGEPFQFTYNTPFPDGGMVDAGDAGLPTTCGRVAFSDYHVTTSVQVQSSACGTDADCGFGSTCMGGTVGTCVPQSCRRNSDCSDSKFTCPVGKGTCACVTDANCAATGSGTCQGAGLADCFCASNADCQAMNAGICHFYSGASCSLSTCYAGSECSQGVCGGHTGTCTASGPCTVANQATQCKSGVCQGGQCAPPATNVCEKAADCGTAETCAGAQIGQCQCQSDVDCPAGGTCSGGTGGTCTIGTCTQDSDCTAGPKACSGAGQQGHCSMATCVDNGDCAGPGLCNNPNSGTCQPNGCTTNADCDGERCAGGVCGGCLSHADCPGGLTCVGGTTGTCTGDYTQFPFACARAPMTPQESAMEFMLLDLTSCVSPDNNSPPPPPVVLTYQPATFTEDFSAVCPLEGGAVGTQPVWREIDWVASIPNSASIVFSAQTVDDNIDGGTPDYTGAQSVVLWQATTSTPPGGLDRALIDVRGDASMPGAFNTATPPVLSKANLRLTVTLNPTSDGLAAPTLGFWQIVYDCAPAE